MNRPGYDPSFANAAASRMADQMQTKCNQTESAGYAQAGSQGPERRNLISGINVQFLANGFLLSPEMHYLGGPETRRIAHVARDKDELLKLIGEMIDAHAGK